MLVLGQLAWVLVPLLTCMGHHSLEVLQIVTFRSLLFFRPIEVYQLFLMILFKLLLELLNVTNVDADGSLADSISWVVVQQLLDRVYLGGFWDLHRLRSLLLLLLFLLELEPPIVRLLHSFHLLRDIQIVVIALDDEIPVLTLIVLSQAHLRIFIWPPVSRDSQQRRSLTNRRHRLLHLARLDLSFISYIPLSLTQVEFLHTAVLLVILPVRVHPLHGAKQIASHLVN